MLLAVVAGITLGARSVGGGGGGNAGPAPAKQNPEGQAVARGHVAVPKEIRGVHVTMSLASLPGKLQRYLALPGLNTVELDVKDENGRVVEALGVPEQEAVRLPQARRLHLRANVIDRVGATEREVLQPRGQTRLAALERGLEVE